MNCSEDMGKLVLKNAELIIDAYNKLQKLDEEFISSIKKYVCKQVDNHQGWWADDFCFAPNDWPHPNKNDYTAYYWITFSGPESYWFRHASGYQNRSMGFAVDVNSSKKLSKSMLENFYNEHSGSLEGAEINKCEGEDYYLFFPFPVINLTDIAKAYPEVVKAPIDETLEKVFKAHAVIDPFVRELAEGE